MACLLAKLLPSLSLSGVLSIRITGGSQCVAQREQVRNNPRYHYMRHMCQRIGIVDTVSLGGRCADLSGSLRTQRLRDVVHQQLGGHLLRDGVKQLNAPALQLGFAAFDRCTN